MAFVSADVNLERTILGRQLPWLAGLDPSMCDQKLTGRTEASGQGSHKLCVSLGQLSLPVLWSRTVLHLLVGVTPYVPFAFACPWHRLFWPQRAFAIIVFSLRSEL